MMATDLRFTGLGKDGAELLCMEPRWWEITKLEERVHLKWVSTYNYGYEDLDANVTLDQARTLHEQFKPKLLELIETNSKAAESTKHLTEISIDREKTLTRNTSENLNQIWRHRIRH